MSKTILVTGGAGFIGHHFVNHLLAATDWNVVVLDRLDFSGDLNRLAEVGFSYSNTLEMKRLKIVFHDLRSEISPHIRDKIGKVDIIAHLAAGSHVDRSIAHPMEFVMDNVVGTTNILEYARHVDNLERFLYFSTDEVFGPVIDGQIFSEYDRYNATNPYSATKAGAEELVVAYENTYKLPAFITHAMNIFGERQHPEKFMPCCTRMVRDDQIVPIHADPETLEPGSRHYVDVRDVSDGLLFLLNYDMSKLDAPPRGASIQKFNLAGSAAIDNLTLAKFIGTAQGKEMRYQKQPIPSTRPGHDLHYAITADRMRAMGWEASDPWDRIREVVQWSLDNPNWL